MKERYLIASHGTLANGFKSAISIILGDSENIDTICAYVEEEFSLNDTITSYINSIDFNSEKLIIFTDLQGGSVNNFFVQLLSKYDFELFSNVNLGFILETIITKGAINIEDNPVIPIDCRLFVDTNEFDDFN